MVDVPAMPAARTRLTPLPDHAVVNRFLPLVSAELRLLLKGQRTWWYLGVLALVVTGLLVPTEGARAVVLPLAWLWPILLWSSLGSRENRHGTAGIVFSAPRARTREPLAAFVAGVLVAFLTAGGVALNVSLSGDTAGLFALAAGAFFVPALAVASGVLSSGSTLFEGIYLPLWYVGPFQKLPALDFAGAAGPGYPLAYLVVAVILVVVAVAARQSG